MSNPFPKSHRHPYEETILWIKSRPGSKSKVPPILSTDLPASEICDTIKTNLHPFARRGSRVCARPQANSDSGAGREGEAVSVGRQISRRETEESKR
jgi:hypothetical protein